MKKNNIINVFKFSLLQSVKNKTFIILTVLCGIIMCILTPTMIYMSNESVNSKTSSIKKIYMIDENNIISKDVDTKIFDKTKFSIIDKEFDTYKDEFIKQKDCKESLLIRATKSDIAYKLDVYKSDKSVIKDTDIMEFNSKLQEFYNTNKIKNIGLETRSYELVTAPKEVNVNIDGVNNSDKDSRNTIIMCVLMVMVFFIVLCGENISTQIVTEKSTKLVEYLLVTIKPLELVCGKIIASVVISFIQMLVMLGCGLISIVVCKSMGIISSYKETLTVLKINQIGDKITIGNIILILGFIVVGFLFYAILAAMLASTVSRLEDLPSANMTFSMIILISMYTIMIVSNVVDSSTLVDNLLVFIPFTSVFITPAYIMLGQLGIVNYIAAILVQIVILWLFAKVAAKVYKALIMYSGNKLSIKRVIEMTYAKKEGDVSA